jgi:hypothetical protein
MMKNVYVQIGIKQKKDQIDQRATSFEYFRQMVEISLSIYREISINSYFEMYMLLLWDRVNPLNELFFL